MYNIGAETDKIVLLQSSLLLGFWHSETDQHVQPWYWTGISVSLCQILGLHRNPDASRRNSAITDQQRHLWRRLWWTCFFRDRWLSLTLGRPMRIDLNDCDVPMTSAADLQSDIAAIPASTTASFIPHDLSWMAQHWVTLIEMSKILGAVLKLNYQTLRARPSLAQVEALEAEIMLCRPSADVEPGLSRESVFYIHHLQLHYQFVPSSLAFPLAPANTERAILIMFYRPYRSETPDGLDSAHQQRWQQRMRREADAAASRTNETLNMLAQEGLLEFALPMTCVKRHRFPVRVAKICH